MKKCMRKLMCLALVVLMVASMTVPVMAEEKGDSDTVGGYNYTWILSRGETDTYAKIYTSPVPTNVTAALTSQFYYDLEKARYESGENKVTGYSSSTATDNNIISINGTLVKAEITAVKGAFWVGSYPITDGFYIGEWLQNLPEEEQA